MNTINRPLAEALYEAATSATPEAATMKLCDLYAAASEADIARAEHFVRSCLVAQGEA